MIPGIICIFLSVFGSGLIVVLLHLFGVADIRFLNRMKLRSGMFSSAIVENVTEAQTSINEEDTANEQKNKKIYTKVQLVIIALASVVVIFIVTILLNFYTFSQPAEVYQYFSFVKLFYVFILVAAAALIDFKTKIIPNRIVVSGLALRAVVYILEFALCREVIKDIFINDLIGFGIGFGVLFLTGVLTRGAIGFGDVKLFAVIGLSTGFMATLGTLFLGLMASAVCGLILLAIYRDKKRTFPFGPFIFLGYLAVIAMGAY